MPLLNTAVLQQFRLFELAVQMGATGQEEPFPALRSDGCKVFSQRQTELERADRPVVTTADANDRRHVGMPSPLGQPRP